jgi:hypothetical protein
VRRERGEGKRGERGERGERMGWRDLFLDPF